MTTGSGGWVRYQQKGFAPVVYARMALRADGRLVVQELYVISERADVPVTIDTNTLRRLPLGRVETWANHAEIRPLILERIEEPDAADLRAALGDTTVPSWVKAGLGWEKPKKSAARLAVPMAKPFGDDFYREVAKVYGDLIRSGVRGPAGLIADANGVAVSRVHRWVKKAREKGFLTAGQRGKAG